MFTSAATNVARVAVPVLAGAALANPVSAVVAATAVVGLAVWKYGECAAETARVTTPRVSRVGTFLRRAIHEWTADEPQVVVKPAALAAAE